MVESAGLLDLNQEPMPDCGPWKAGGVCGVCGGCGVGVIEQARVSGRRLSIEGGAYIKLLRRWHLRRWWINVYPSRSNC